MCMCAMYGCLLLIEVCCLLLLSSLFSASLAQSVREKDSWLEDMEKQQEEDATIRKRLEELENVDQKVQEVC